MEGEMIEQDEFEKLLGEIPNVTTRNHIAEEHAMNNLSSEPKPMSAEVDRNTSRSINFTNLYGSPQAVKHALYGSITCPKTPFDLKNQCNGNQESTYANQVYIDQEKSNLPDEQSLVSAFEELSFDPTSGSDSLLLDGQIAMHLSNSLSQLNPPEMSIPPSANILNGFHSSSPAPQACPPFMITGEANQFSDNIDGLNYKRFSRPHELKKQRESLLGDFREQHQDIPLCNFPVNSAMHAFQLFPGIGFEGLDLPGSALQQQYYMDGHSTAYIHPQNLSRGSTTWRNMDAERYCQMNTQYIHLQQLQNQGPPFHQVRNVMNSAIGPLNANMAQPYFDTHVPHQIKLPNQDSYLNDDSFQAYNQYDLSLLVGAHYRHYPQGTCTKGDICGIANGQNPASACNLTQSAKEFVGHQVLERAHKQIFPEKILTRSDGVNSLRSLRSSATDNIPLYHSNSNMRLFNHGNGFRSRGISNRSLHMDGQNTEGSSPTKSEFRRVSEMTEVNYTSLDEVKGRIYIMAKDQHGCRFLQEKFTKGAPEDVDKIFVEIIGHIVDLMTDPFGNYLVQKLLDVCNKDQKMAILQEITRNAGKLIDVSCDMHGTRAVQKVIEILKTPEQFSVIVSSLKPGIVRVIKDVNGNHVAQRCLQHLSPEHCEFLFDAAIAHCIELATDRQGCCVLQKCLACSNGDRKERLVSEITSNALFLAQDRYGNYVVQFVLDLKVPWTIEQVLDQLVGHYVDLSMQKFSSNVVEKCLKLAEDRERIDIVQELLSDPRLLRILQDPYGNYVMQSALKVCKGALHAALVEAIQPHIPSLESSSYGRKVLSNASLKK